MSITLDTTLYKVEEIHFLQFMGASRRNGLLEQMRSDEQYLFRIPGRRTYGIVYYIKLKIKLMNSETRV